MTDLNFGFLGSDVVIWDLAQIIVPEEIRLCHHVMIDDFAFLNGRGGIFVGPYVHIVSFASVTGGGGCSIGAFSCVSAGARIFSGTENIEGSLFGPLIPQGFRKAIRRRVRIGRYVLVGANAVILPGARLHDGVVIGAGSVVLQGQVCDPWGVYVGTPVRRIRDRPSEPIVEMGNKLLEESA